VYEISIILTAMSSSGTSSHDVLREGGPRQPGIAPGLVLLLAATAAATVANLYYAQPLLPEMARSLGVSARTVAWVPVLTQVGYAFGLFLFIPLGDAVERRRLILALVLASAAALAGAALAPGAAWLALASLAVGVFSVVPHVAVPLAAHLAAPGERGRVIGLIMSGVLAGILLARTAAGLVGGAFGWRAVYGLAAAGMVVLTLALARLLPHAPPERSVRYPELLASLWTLVRREPELRQASLIGAMGFGAFSVFWTTLAFFLETPPYHWGAEGAGLFGLVGLAGALAAPVVGRVADRRGARFATGVALAVALASFALFALAGTNLAGLIAGVVLLDVGVQSAHVSNLARIHALEPGARSRRNTVYMVSYFAGGALGTWLGVRAWVHLGWPGVCATGAAFVVAGLLAWRRRVISAPPRTPDAAPPR
jgi:predicted MFS family arabinose efflux permease